MLYGRFQHNIDAKGRIFVPAKLRTKLGDNFIAAAILDNCVSLYSTDEWEKLLGGLNELPYTKARKIQRHFSSNAMDVTVDSQGRILLPRHLMEYAGLEKETIVIGAGNRAEIWDINRYNQEEQAMTQDNIENDLMEIGF